MCFITQTMFSMQLVFKMFNLEFSLLQNKLFVYLENDWKMMKQYSENVLYNIRVLEMTGQNI